jgi:hypothetical protein
VQKLVKAVEGSDGFRDAKARRRFGPDLRWWAFLWILRRDEALPRSEGKKVHLQDRNLSLREQRGASPGPSPAERRATLRMLSKRIEEAGAATGKITQALAEMDAFAYDAFSPSLALPDASARTRSGEPSEAQQTARESAAAIIADRGERRRAWLRELSTMHSRLAWLKRAGDLSLGNISPTDGPKERDLHRRAIEDLWRLWANATGKQPARDNSRRGPFYGFVHETMQRIWPGMGSAHGLIDQVCTQLRAAPRQVGA